MNSSKVRPSDNLAARLDAFLLDFANADFSRSKSAAKVERRFSDLMPEVPVMGKVVVTARPRVDLSPLSGAPIPPAPLKRIDPQEFRPQQLAGLQQHLRRAWVAQTRRERRYCIWQLLETHYLALWRRRVRELPNTVTRTENGYERTGALTPTHSEVLHDRAPVSPFDDVVARLEDLEGRTKLCANSACDVTPYFIAARKSQAYCSEGCALPAQREAKRRWWASDGPGWRAKRNELKDREGKPPREGKKNVKAR
jgi:hypothetical protein